MRIGFIGLGNMASAIIGGILKTGIYANTDLCGADMNPATTIAAAERFAIQTGTDNKVVASTSDILFLAVKPQYMEDAIDQIRDCIDKNTCIVSIAPGKTLEWLLNQFGKETKIVRCMPNTPALVSEGCTGVCKNGYVTEEEMDIVMAILKSFGTANIVPEHLMDVVVGISGSSPAYVFMFIEAMADAAVAGGMPRKQAYEFAAQAVLGSAKMVLETGKHPGELKDMVCSPAGTTIDAVRELERGNFRATIMDAVQTCIDKSKSL